MNPPAQKTKRGMRDSIWITTSRLLAQISQFGIFVIAARQLQPAEFGAFALVAAFIVFLNQFATAGWSEYILNWKGDTRRLRETVFVALCVGMAAALIGIAISFPLSVVFHHEDVRSIAQVLAISVFFAAAASTYAGILVWQDRLSTSASCALFGEIVTFAVTVPALLGGWGIMGMAVGRLAGAIGFFLATVLFVRMLPAVPQSFSVFREIAAFSWHITLTRLLITLRVYGATLIIGAFMGAAAVGYYRTAQRIVGAFEEIVSEPVRILTWSVFRKVPQSEDIRAGFRQAALRFFPLLIYASAPLFIGITVMAHDLVNGILGPEWAPAAPVMQILAIAALIRAPGTSSVPILSLVGKVTRLPLYMVIYSTISITCITTGATFGLIPTAVSEVIAASIVFAVSAGIMRRNAGVWWPEILRKSWPVVPAIALSLLVPYVVYSQDWLTDWFPLVRFVVLGLAMLVIYIPVILLLDRSVIRTPSAPESS